MPHDKKGRLIEVGDHIKFEVCESWDDMRRDFNRRVTVGRVFSVSPGQESCNVSAVHLAPSYWPLKQDTLTAKNAELVLKADGSEPAEAIPQADGAGFGRLGAIVAMLLLALVCLGVPVFAADEPPACGTKEKPEACLSLTTGVVTVVTRGERREYATMGASIEAPIGGFALFASVDMFGVQDGGSIDTRNPQSFRSTKLEGGITRRAGAFDLNARGGVTFSVEGQVGRPIDPRMLDALLEAELRLDGDGRIAIRGGHDGTVGGWALGADVVVPVFGGPSIVAHYDFPFSRSVTGTLPYVVTAGVRVRVKSFRLSLPK